MMYYNYIVYHVKVKVYSISDIGAEYAKKRARV